MIRNFIFLFLTVASLTWIVYAGQNIINFTGNENPERIFGQEDGRVFIMNRPGEIELSSTDFHLQPRLIELYNILKANQSLDERIIVSELKAHVVVEKTHPIDKERVKLLFGDESLLEVTSKKYLWKEFTVERNKGVLEIYIASEKTSTTDEKWYTFDKKSSCSVVEFNHGDPIITDYYQKDGIVSSYARSPFLTKPSRDVNDKEMFANRIPVYISQYEFIEKEYAKKHDKEFRDGIANEWVNLGMVSFEYKKHSFLLMDFVKGKEPDLYLDTYRDLTGESNRKYTKLQLTHSFPKNAKSGVYMRIFEDHVLFAENEEALVDLEASLELGQMLSLNKEKSEIVFGQTPQKVCYRNWSNKTKIAKSTYNGSALEVTVLAAQDIPDSPDEIENSPAGVGLDSPLLQMLVQQKTGLVYTLSQSNTLYGLENDKVKFKKELKEAIKGNIRWVDEQQDDWMVTSLNNLHVFDKNGSYKSGFPVSIEKGISKEARPFTWKGKTNYLLSTNEGKFIWLNESGEELGTGEMEITNLTDNPVAWVSQKRLFFGFHGDGNFTMIEAEKNKLLRTFPLPIGVHTVVLSNEVVFFNLEKQALYKYNQRGSKTKIANLQNPKWLQADASNDGDFYISEGTKLYHYTANGKMKSTLKGDFQSIDYILHMDKTSKGSVVGVVDGMHNRIELYRKDGNRIQLKTNQGQRSLGISTYNGQSKLYTISDKFVIHYVL